MKKKETTSNMKYKKKLHVIRKKALRESILYLQNSQLALVP